jgi:CBS domain containing-hemolysin-like protein
VERGVRGAQAALRLMDDPVRVISTTQVGITAIGVLTGAVGEPLVLDLLGDDLPGGLAFLIAFGRDVPVRHAAAGLRRGRPLARRRRLRITRNA